MTSKLFQSLLLLPFLVGCGGNNTDSPTLNPPSAPAVVTVSVSPQNASTTVNVLAQFTATVTGTTNKAVTWTFTGVNEDLKRTGGTSISGTGSFLSSTAGAYTVIATSVADPTASGSARVTVNPAPIISILLTSPVPAQTTPGGTLQYKAVVAGSTNTKVDWSVVSDGGGTISSTGLYTAPATPGNYTIKATADADQTVSATATASVVTANGGLGGTIQ